MYCPECGKKMEEGASFCSYCGTRVLMIENDADDRDFSPGETRIFGEGPKNSGDEHIPGTKTVLVEKNSEGGGQPSPAKPEGPEHAAPPRKTERQITQRNRERRKRNAGDILFLVGAAVVTVFVIFLFVIVTRGMKGGMSSVGDTDSVLESAVSSAGHAAIDTEAAMSAAIKAAEAEESRKAEALAKEEAAKAEEEARKKAETEIRNITSSTVQDPAIHTPTPTPTPTLTPVPVEPTAVSLSAAPADLGTLKTARFSAASATSRLVQADKTINNAAEMAIDSDTVTSWQEGAQGDGIGEQITLTLSEPKKVRCIGLYLGNWREPFTYDNNNRPKEMTVTVNGKSYELSFTDAMIPQYIDFNVPVETNMITFTIKSVYPGKSPGDTCISEVIPYVTE